MTDATVEAVARAICRARMIREAGEEEFEEQFVEGLWPRCAVEAEAAITAYLKALEEEGKRVISESNLQELVTNRNIYEG